jgi:hypothetical protein
MGDRSGCGPVELAVLEAVDALTGRRQPVFCAKVVARVEERIGLGPRYGYDLLLDMGRPWTIPLRLVAVYGNYGARTFPASEPGGTRCRLSDAGALVLDAEAGRRAPVPIALINGSMYRGGSQPPLAPFAVLAALLRLLADPGVTDSEIVQIVGPPQFASGTEVSGDLAALYEGREILLCQTGRITRTAIPVPDPAPDPPAPPAGPFRLAPGRKPRKPGHLVIESLPSEVTIEAVEQAISYRVVPERALAAHLELGRDSLPIALVDDQSAVDLISINITLRPGADPGTVRERLSTIAGIAYHAPARFPAPLGSLLRSWIDRHRDENIAESLTSLENAIRRDRDREQRHR